MTRIKFRELGNFTFIYLSLLRILSYLILNYQNAVMHYEFHLSKNSISVFKNKKKTK